MIFQNTTENKVKFFMQYYNQFIVRSNKDCSTSLNDLDYIDIEDSFLQLKSVQFIDDKDAKKLIYSAITLIGIDGALIKSDNVEIIKILLRNYFKSDTLHNLPSCMIDELRSMGYAVPFMAVKVDELIKWGWVKIVD